MATEIKNGAVHCFSDCGYDCKGQVKIDLEKHYAGIVEQLGEGWTVRSWHNGGWHCKALHEASGFEVRDHQVIGAISQVRHYLSQPGKRFICMNYSGDHTSQVMAYGDTPKQAVNAAVEEMAARAQAYAALAQDLMRKVK